MSLDEMLHLNTELKLQPSQTENVCIGRLPLGKFIYRLSLRNPTASVSQLTVRISSDTSSLSEQTFILKDIAEHIEFGFSSRSHEAPYFLSFSLKGTGEVFLSLPVSPLKLQEIQNTEPALNGLKEQLFAQMQAYEGVSPSGNIQSSSKNSFQPGNTPQINLTEVESFINHRYFRGFLSQEEAEHQLDHVVLYKLFQPDGTKGWNKYKRALYRRILIALYRLLTKNRRRKIYFSKLYRNYVNNNLISENFHHY